MTPRRRRKDGSPVSVLGLNHHDDDNNEKTSLMNPIVIVGQDGETEVTLEQHPRRELTAFLDTDMTPTKSPWETNGCLSPSRASPVATNSNTPRSPMGASSQLCCGVVGSWTDEERQLAIPNSMEETICGLLEDADLCGLQFLVLSDAPKQEIKRVLKNRAWDSNSKSQRIKALQDNLDPFGQLERVEQLGRKPSFCHANYDARAKKLPTREQPESTMSWLLCSSEPKQDSPAVIRTNVEDLCYDSDPEDITRRGKTAKSFQRGNRKSFLQPKRLNFDFQENVKEQVKAMMNQRRTLIWHRGGNGKNDASPLAVKAWIEHGHRLRSTLIQPKLMWKPANESANHKSALGISSENLYSLDLLDFLRILEADRTDTKRFALAKRTHSFVIESHDEFILFETLCQEERDRIVHGLKLVVARLGSKVVAGEQDVFEEFFGFVPVGGLE